MGPFTPSSILNLGGDSVEVGGLNSKKGLRYLEKYILAVSKTTNQNVYIKEDFPPPEIFENDQILSALERVVNDTLNHIHIGFSKEDDITSKENVINKLHKENPKLYELIARYPSNFSLYMSKPSLHFYVIGKERVVTEYPCPKGDFWCATFYPPSVGFNIEERATKWKGIFEENVIEKFSMPQ